MKNFARLIPKLACAACLVCASAAADDADALRDKLLKFLPPGNTLTSIAESPMPGVYDVVTRAQRFYAHGNGAYVLIGDVYDLERGVSLGTEKEQAGMLAALADMPESEMIVMGDADAKRHVTVFTDTDCGYCQKFHDGIGALANGGLKVRYLMFPRAGLNSASYAEAVSVWCAKEQGQAMTIAKAGGRVAPAICDNPVAAQFQLGQQIGVRGTPTMILDTGQVIPGYVPPAQLLAEIAKSAPAE